MIPAMNSARAMALVGAALVQGRLATIRGTADRKGDVVAVGGRVLAREQPLRDLVASV